MVSAPRPPDAWLGSAPPPQRVRRLLAGRSGRAPGARVPKKSRFSPVSGLSVDCGGILPCVAGPCFKRRMTHLGAAPRRHRVRRLRARRCGGAPGRGKGPEKVPIQSGFCVICRLRRYSSARRRAFLPPRPAFISKYVLRPIPILAPCSWWEIIAESQAASRRAPRFGATPALEITGNLTTHSSVSSWNSRFRSE